jgi:hypothetical protein
MVGHIAKSEKDSGKSDKEAEDIAWATANKRGYLDNKNKKAHEESMMEEPESPAQVVSCNQDNPENAAEACAMEESAMSDLDAAVGFAMERLTAMDAAQMDWGDASARVVDELRQQGYNEAEISHIMNAVNDEMENPDDYDDGMDGDFDSAMASAGQGSDEDYGYYGDDMEESADRKLPEVLNANEINAMAKLPHEAAKQKGAELISKTSTKDEKKAYLLSRLEQTRNTMGVVKMLYDMLLAGEGNRVQGSAYSKRFGMEEDIQNGYNDVNTVCGDDFFPNGADGPVVKSTGPSGARHGDNPEQKKMQVDEAHKELVYAYRSFLKESAL